MAVIDKEKIWKQVNDEDRPWPICTICRKPIDIGDGGWQAVERVRGHITFICGECMKK